MDKRKQSEFIRIPFSILTDRDLTKTAKILYGVLWYRQRDNGHCWPSFKRLTVDIGCGEATLSRAITQLEEKGYLLKKKGGGRKGTNSYSVKLTNFQNEGDQDESSNTFKTEDVTLSKRKTEVEKEVEKEKEKEGEEITPPSSFSSKETEKQKDSNPSKSITPQVEFLTYFGQLFNERYGEPYHPNKYKDIALISRTLAKGISLDQLKWKARLSFDQLRPKDGRVTIPFLLHPTCLNSIRERFEPDEYKTRWLWYCIREGEPFEKYLKHEKDSEYPEKLVRYLQAEGRASSADKIKAWMEAPKPEVNPEIPSPVERIPAEPFGMKRIFDICKTCCKKCKEEMGIRDQPDEFLCSNVIRMAETNTL